jgi:hypothetical protein
MFGYYAVRILDASNFWDSDDPRQLVNPISPYWEIFTDFATKAKAAESEYRTKSQKGPASLFPRRLRF